MKANTLYISISAGDPFPAGALIKELDAASWPITEGIAAKLIRRQRESWLLRRLSKTAAESDFVGVFQHCPLPLPPPSMLAPKSQRLSIE